MLSIIALKVCAFAICKFGSSANLVSIEKSAEENKDKEEEAFDKAKKKLLLYESSLISHDHPLWVNHVSPCLPQGYLQTDNFPSKSVPTPPPDFIS